MAELPYMPVHVADAIADAEGLTNEELGALVRIRWAMWRAGGLIAEGRLIRFSRAGKRWGAVGPAVLERLQVYGGKVSCPVVTSLLVTTRERRLKRAQAGRAGAAARGSEGILKPGTEGILNGRKALKIHDVPVELLGPALKQTATNQNQNKEKAESASAAASPALSPGAARSQHEALYRDGVALLMERAGVRRTEAFRSLSRWLNLCGGNAEAVAAMLALADRENFTGQAFSRMVEGWAEERQREDTKGLTLPLGPTRLKTAGGGQ